MRKVLLLPRFLALFLALCLALPCPALALRTLEPLESGLEEQIARRLGVPSAAGSEGADPSKVLLPRHEGEKKALQWMKRMTQEKRPYLFAVGDVDWLGMLNKVYSKKLVNPVLTQIFQILREEVERRGGLVYRHGGDEFVILLPLARQRGGEPDGKKAVEQGKGDLKQIREAVAQQLLHRYVVVQSRALRAEAPKGFRARVRARSRYAGTTYFLLEVPQDRTGRRFNPYAYARRIERAARAQGLPELRPAEIFGNESQFGFVNAHGKEFPVSVSLGGEIVLPSGGRVRKEEVAHGNLLKLHRRLLLDAEDWQKQAKVLFPWKNVEAVGISLGAKKHAHNEGRLLSRPPAIGTEPLQLQYYTPEKVREEVKRDLANGRSGILLQLVPRYQWNGPLELKYRDGPFARFKAINEFLGYGAGDDQIKLLLVEAVKEFGRFPGFKVTVARAPPTESPDMDQIWISWAGDQRAPGPSEGEPWSRLRSAMVEKIGKVRDGINRTLKEDILPALADLGLQVTLDWAAAVADANQDPEADKVFERLQSAMMVMTDRRHQAPNEAVHGFLLHPLVANASMVERSRVNVERVHRRAALAEAKEMVSPQRLRAAREAIGGSAAGLEEEKDLGTLDYGQEMLRVLVEEAYAAANKAVEDEGVKALEVHLLNETPAVSRRAALSLDLGREAEPAGWYEQLLHAMEEAGIGFGYWAVRARRWTSVGGQPAISFSFQPASAPVRAEVDGQWMTFPAGGVLFDGLTSRESDGQVRLATDLLPVRVVIAGLQEGAQSLVLLTPKVTYAGKIYLERGVQLRPDVATALGSERIRLLPEDLAQWREFLRAEGGGRPFVVMDDPAGTRAAALSRTALVLNLPREVAAQLSLAQLASLEAALRQRGTLPRLGELVERDWTGPLDVFRVAA